MGILPRREVIVVSDRVYEWFERLTKKHGLSANDLMSKYFEMFGHLARYFEDDVELLRQNFREVPTSTLLQLALYRLLLSSGNIHEMLKYALEHLELYKRGYVLQGVLAAREETGEITGVVSRGNKTSTLHLVRYYPCKTALWQRVALET